MALRCPLRGRIVFSDELFSFGFVYLIGKTFLFLKVFVDFLPSLLYNANTYEKEYIHA